MRSISITDFLQRKFNTYPIQGDWLDSFGEVEKNFKMLIYGASGNGKTEFCVKLAKYLSQFAKVYYNSYEQGISKTLQDALVRNNMAEVKGRVMFGDKVSVADMHILLKGKNAPQIIIIDSRDYINLTTEQFKKLIKTFPHKAFIVVCWEKAKKPKGVYAQEMLFMCDVKIRVADFTAYVTSRYGGNKNMVIWNRKQTTGSQLKLM